MRKSPTGENKLSTLPTNRLPLPLQGFGPSLFSDRWLVAGLGGIGRLVAGPDGVGRSSLMVKLVGGVMPSDDPVTAAGVTGLEQAKRMKSARIASRPDMSPSSTSSRRRRCLFPLSSFTSGSSPRRILRGASGVGGGGSSSQATRLLRAGVRESGLAYREVGVAGWSFSSSCVEKRGPPDGGGVSDVGSHASWIPMGD